MFIVARQAYIYIYIYVYINKLKRSKSFWVLVIITRKFSVSHASRIFSLWCSPAGRTCQKFLRRSAPPQPLAPQPSKSWEFYSNIILSFFFQAPIHHINETIRVIRLIETCAESFSFNCSTRSVFVTEHDCIISLIRRYSRKLGHMIWHLFAHSRGERNRE